LIISGPGKKYGWETSCVSYHYLMRFMDQPKLNTPDTGKAIVEVGQRPEFIPAPIEQLIDVAVIHRPFDVKAYKSKGRQGRKRMVLDTMHEGMLALAEHKDWPSEPFIAAYEAVLEENIHCVGMQAKGVLSPDRRHTARQAWDLDTDMLRLFIVVQDRSGKELRRVRYETIMPFGYVLGNLGKLEWVDDKTVRLLSREGEVDYTVKVGKRRFWRR
jgi:hypothetical protein